MNMSWFLTQARDSATDGGQLYRENQYDRVHSKDFETLQSTLFFFFLMHIKNSTNSLMRDKARQITVTQHFFFTLLVQIQAGNYRFQLLVGFLGIQDSVVT